MAGRPRKLIADLPLDAPAVVDAVPAPAERDGRKRVALPDLPDVETYFLRNPHPRHFIVTSNKQGVADLMIAPGSEATLRDSEFWLSNRDFRVLIEDFTDQNGQLQPAPVEVFKRTHKYLEPRPVPAALQKETRSRYQAHIEVICYGEFTEAQEWVDLQPFMGPDENVLDVKYLMEDWRPVLETCLWLLNDNRRCGKEVDQRRLDLIKARLDHIENLRRQSGIGVNLTVALPESGND